MCREVYPISNLSIKLIEKESNSLFSVEEEKDKKRFTIFNNSDLFALLSNDKYSSVGVHTAENDMLFYANRDSCAYRKSEIGFIAGRQGCIPYLVMNLGSTEPLKVTVRGKQYFPAYVAYHPDINRLEYRCGYLRADLNGDEQAQFDEIYKRNSSNPYDVYFGFDESNGTHDALIINEYEYYDCQ